MEPEASQAVVFRDVTKTFNKTFRALDGLTFSIKRGELYGLIGPNGAGKTTSIRVMTGLVSAGGGQVSVLGLQPNDPAVRSHVGYMPQETALYLDLTVRENLELFGRLYDMDKKYLKARIKELLEFVNLTDWADKVITELSGGMQHRASLAAALLPKPKLLILDEPTVGVDPELRATFWDRFRSMQAEGTTILITTHYMDEAMRCERVGLVNHGRLIAEDAPAELIRKTGTKSLEDAFLKLAGRKEVAK
ncbi:MAG TPA: ABC transporter ATP-binding protein [Candidatus Saccharimonadia bacterium]|jgi:ABC-2 type transport system ATP-binding protein